MTPIERDPARPTPEELRETAASEGLMATEEETDPDYVDPEFVDPADVVGTDGDRDTA
jgi:hypothetical protein